MFYLMLFIISACTRPVDNGQDYNIEDMFNPGPELDPEDIFNPIQVLEYHVTIAESDWEHIEEHGLDEEYRPAELQVKGYKVDEQVGHIGFRHKGAIGTLFNCWQSAQETSTSTAATTEQQELVRIRDSYCAKLSYKFKFDLYDENKRFAKLKRLNLHAHLSETTWLRDLLSYQLFNDFGVIAPRAVPAKLFINGQLMGLFIAIEEIDGRFTHFRFPKPGDGNLYKEIWPNPKVYYLPNQQGVNPDYISSIRTALTTNEDEGDISDFTKMTVALNKVSAETFATDMAAWLNIDELLRYIAVDRAIKNWDGFTAWYTCALPDCVAMSCHNVYWYHDDGTESRFHLIPWDLDNALVEHDPYIDPQIGWGAASPIPNWNVKPASCEPITAWLDDAELTYLVPSGCDKLINLLAATRWQRFVEISQELMALIDQKVLQAKLDKWATLIEPIIIEDPYVDAEVWQQEREYLRNTILPKLVTDFQVMLQQGYIDQTQ